MPESARIATLRSVELDVPDLAAAQAFLTGPWGLTFRAGAAGRAWLAGTGTDHHCVALREGPVAGIRSMTFRARTAAVLQDILADAAASGATDLQGPQTSDDPAGGTVIAFRDPQGRGVRVVHGDMQGPQITPPRDLPTGLAHVNANTSDIDGAVDFYGRVLGFSLTDRSKMMAFIRCNRDHHTIVLADTDVDTLNHVAFLVPDWESVMRVAGRLIDAGHPIGWGVGRHGPGDNVFAYFQTPMGFVMEVTAEVLQVDDSYRVGGPGDWVWPPGRIDQWGIAPHPSPEVRAAQRAIPFLPG
jgi:catechol 2,3-dioxygenase-like lactoylglutathione lyase family enzyme